MTNILIPTNFNQETLECIPELTETFPGLQLNVLLFHAFGLSSSITDLLMLSRRSKEEFQISDEFCQGCVDLEQEYDQINTVNWTYFYGTTMAAFRNFLKANRIDFIVCPSNYKLQKLSKQSLDPVLFLEKSGLPVIPITPYVSETAKKLEQVY